MHLLRRAAPPGTTTAPLERSSLKTAAQGQFCKPRVEKNSPFSDARSRRRAGQGGMIFDLSKPMATLTTPELCVNRQFCPSRSEARIYELHEGVSQACGWRNSRIWRVGHRRSGQPNAAGDRAWPCCPPRRALDFWFFRNLLVIFNWLVWLMCEKWRRAFKEWGPGNDDVAKRG